MVVSVAVDVVSTLDTSATTSTVPGRPPTWSVDPQLHRGADGDDDAALLERPEAGQLGAHRVLAGVEPDETEVAGVVSDLLLTDRCGR